MATSPQPRARVTVLRKLFDTHIARLSAHFDVEDNQADALLDPRAIAQRLALADAAVITGGERIDAEVLAHAQRLRLIATVSVGYNHIDLAACAARGITVTHTPDVLTETTADFGFALMMAAARRVTEAERWLRAGHWQRWQIDQLVGVDLFGSTLCILGMGRIGQAIARRAAGFGMSVRYHNRGALPPAKERALNAQRLAFDDLLQAADHLMIVLPYSSAVHHLIGARELALMKPSATLTNIARGGIVDESALAAALRSGRLAAAGLDVYEGEPAVCAELLNLERVALTPHIASASRPTRQKMGDLAVDNVIAVLGGAAPLSAVTL
jgi:gluconate 2-dehydrogenase